MLTIVASPYLLAVGFEYRYNTLISDPSSKTRPECISTCRLLNRRTKVSLLSKSRSLSVSVKGVAMVVLGGCSGLLSKVKATVHRQLGIVEFTQGFVVN